MPIRIAVLGLALAIFAPGAVLGLEKPKLPFEEFGELDGVRYEIVIPEGWNGGLIMYAHGYISPSTPYVFNPEKPPRPAENVLTYARARGYATARSAFSRNGMNWLPAAHETAALRDHFAQRFGLKGPAILTGLHGGGMVVRHAAEHHADKFDGFISYAGSGGSMLTVYRQMVEQRALFDYFFPGLPGSAVDYAGEGGGWIAPRALELMKAGDPRNVADFLRMTGRGTAEDAAWALGVWSNNLRDVMAFETGGRNAFDTTGVVYWGSSDDGAVNRGVKRYAADPEAAAHIRDRWGMTGRIEKPMLSLNSTDDPAVPAYLVREYLDLVQLAGRSELYVQLWAHQKGPVYDALQTKTTIDMMEAWIKTGKRPAQGIEIKAAGAP